MRHDINITSTEITIVLKSDQPSNQRQDEPKFFAQAADRLERVAKWLRTLT